MPIPRYRGRPLTAPVPDFCSITERVEVMRIRDLDARVKAQLDLHGLTMTELASRMGIGLRTLSTYIKNPSMGLGQLKAISVGMGVDGEFWTGGWSLDQLAADARLDARERMRADAKSGLALAKELYGTPG